MKSLIWMPFGMAAAAGAALLILRGTTGEPHLSDTLIAAAIATLSAEIALLPAVLARRAHPATVSQAALAGTVLHLFLTIAVAAIAYIGKLVPDRRLFVFLILGFYWISLVLIVLVMIGTVRRASPPAPNKA